MVNTFAASTTRWRSFLLKYKYNINVTFVDNVEASYAKEEHDSVDDEIRADRGPSTRISTNVFCVQPSR